MAGGRGPRSLSPGRRTARDRLMSVFTPRSIAVIGASNAPGKAGYQVLRSLRQARYRGRIFPVNPREKTILGLAAWTSILEIPGPLDLLIISVPAMSVGPIVRDAEIRGDVKGAIILSAGFSETGDAELVKAERELSNVAQRSGIRIFGPNCIGIINPSHRLITGFAPGIRLIPGDIGYITQSGAFGGALLMLAAVQPRPLGFAKFAHVGNMCDVSNLELLDLFARDPDIRVVAMYMEGVRDGRSFIDLSSRASARKPLFVLKAGRTDVGAKAALSHTGTLAGSDSVYDAAFRQGGAIRVRTLQELSDAAKAASMLPRPRGRNVCVLTEAGGPGILCMDELASRGVLTPVELAESTKSRLRTILPSMSVISRPPGYVDMTAAAMAAEHASALRYILADPDVDSVIIISVPPTFLPAMDVAKGLAEAAASRKKPVLVCLMRGEPVAKARAYLEARGIPTFDTPEGAAAALSALTQSILVKGHRLPAGIHPKTHPLIEQARAEGRDLLEPEALRFLSDNGIRIPPFHLASSRREAQEYAGLFGGAVVLKIVSPQVLHKSEVGGVKIGPKDRNEVGKAYDSLIRAVQRIKPRAEIQGVLVLPLAKPGPEMILGMSRDPQFGPVVMAGGGGIYVEVLHDVSFRIAPFGSEVAEEMIRETASYRVLSGVRGQPRADIEALADLAEKLSLVSMRYQEISSMDLNPVRVYSKGFAILDVRVLLTRS